MASNSFYITKSDWAIHENPPSGKYLKFENTKFSYSHDTNRPTPLKINLEKVFYFAGVSRNHLETMVKSLFSLYYMPNRIEFNNDSDSVAVEIVDGTSGVSLTKIVLREDAANPLILVHELLHYCILKMGYTDYGNHAGEYVSSPCKNLLIFNHGTPGILCDARTILAANYSNITFPTGAQHHEMLFPEISYAYNLDFAERCGMQNIAKSKQSLEKTKATKFPYEKKFGFEYDFLKKHINENIFGSLSRKTYIRNNMEQINIKKK